MLCFKVRIDFMQIAGLSCMVLESAIALSTWLAYMYDI